MSQQRDWRGFPVAVRVFDSHGYVSGVRLFPNGKALMHNGDWETESVVVPPPKEGFPHPTSKLAFFDLDIEAETVRLFCSRRDHWIEVPVQVLVDAVQVFRKGGPPGRLVVG